MSTGTLVVAQRIRHGLCSRRLIPDTTCEPVQCRKVPPADLHAQILLCLPRPDVPYTFRSKSRQRAMSQSKCKHFPQKPGERQQDASRPQPPVPFPAADCKELYPRRPVSQKRTGAAASSLRSPAEARKNGTGTRCSRRLHPRSFPVNSISLSGKSAGNCFVRSQTQMSVIQQHRQAASGAADRNPADCFSRAPSRQNGSGLPARCPRKPPALPHKTDSAHRFLLLYSFPHRPSRRQSFRNLHKNSAIFLEALDIFIVSCYT